MIKYTIDQKTLVVPSGLGNLGQSAGSGGGISPEEAAEIASAVTAEALDEYDTELQVDLEDIRDAVSGNSEDISALSGVTETISQQIGSLSGLTDDIAAISGQTSANTQDIGILSGQTTANTEDISELSGVTSGLSSGLQELSGETAGIQTAIVQLSGATQGIEQSVATLSGAVKEDFYIDAAAYYSAATNDERTAIWELAAQKYLDGHNVYLKGKISNYTVILPLVKYEPYVEGQTYSGQLDFVAKDGNPDKFFDINLWHRGNIPSQIGPGGTFSTMSIATNWVYPTASSSTKGCIKVGSGLTMSGEVMSIKAGDGLGFSGDTLVVSGGTGGGPAVYILNLLTEQERIALYNEVMAYRYAPSYIGVQSGFPASDYAFYYWAGEDGSDEFNGDFRGFVPLQLAALHPDDYGGAAFFSGMVLSRNGGGLIRTIKYVIASDGSVDMARGTNNWDPHPEASYIYVDSDGTFRNDLWSLGNITNTDIIYRLNVRYNNNDNYSLGPVTEYRKNTEEVATDDWRNVYYFSTVISINGTTYKGTWRIVDYGDWEGQGPYPATSWTTV